MPVMEGGRRLTAGDDEPENARKRAAAELGRLPEGMRRLETDLEAYPVAVSERLRILRDELASKA